jgi:hypothetical protein
MIVRCKSAQRLPLHAEAGHGRSAPQNSVARRQPGRGRHLAGLGMFSCSFMGCSTPDYRVDIVVAYLVHTSGVDNFPVKIKRPPSFQSRGTGHWRHDSRIGDTFSARQLSCPGDRLGGRVRRQEWRFSGNPCPYASRTGDLSDQFEYFPELRSPAVLNQLVQAHLQPGDGHALARQFVGGKLYILRLAGGDAVTNQVHVIP